jgi:poly-gamma-glutamate capsule biosynthesis protein CapA/YwtB (metallophosphatase superfamily)
VRLALAGDTMLGRGVAQRLTEADPSSLVGAEVVEFAARADLFVLNLECCISDRGSPWPAPGKPFFFRAPPEAVDLLTHLGVRCVTLANNHALDYGEEALADTIELLDRASIAHAGAGMDLEAARRPAVLDGVEVVAFSDHPEDFAASGDRPGIAFADLGQGLPGWIERTVRDSAADVTLVMPHWGPNMTPEPIPAVRKAAETLVGSGADLVAGHSAHLFHGVRGCVLFDLGDFLDDYAVDPHLRNDLGLLWMVEVDRDGPRRLEALPLKLDYCFTGPAHGADAAWIGERFRAACEDLGTTVSQTDGILTVEW